MSVLKKADRDRATGIRLPDFREVVHRLRGQLQTAYEMGAPPVEHAAFTAALMTAEREWATQAVVALYDHLKHHEQWRAAAYLLAYCVPAKLRDDPRIEEVVVDAMKIAETVKDPETERAAYYLDYLHEVPDAYLRSPLSMHARGHWMVTCAQLTRSKKVLEFATGCGSNVFHATLLEPKIQWCGVDVSKRQADANQSQAVKLGFTAIERSVEFRAHSHAEWFGTFDAVAVLDTLEHTVYPYELLDEAEKYVKPNGVVIVSVPHGPWSPFTPNLQAVGAGQHIATMDVATLQGMLGSRGEILSMEVLPNRHEPHHGNAVVGACYSPWED